MYKEWKWNIPSINSWLPISVQISVKKKWQLLIILLISVIYYRSQFVCFVLSFDFYTLVSRRSVLCNGVWRAGGRPHRFQHNNFISVYLIFTKLGHMIALWKGKNPIYFGVISSKVKVTVTINRFFDNRVISAW